MKIAVFAVIDHQVSQIMGAADAIIAEKSFVKANMNSYCSNRMVKLVNQLNGQLITKENESTCLITERQPINLGQDTMMSINNLETVQQTVTLEKAHTVVSDHKSTSRSINKARRVEHKSSMINISENNNNNDNKVKKNQEQAHIFTKVNVHEIEKQDEEISEIRKVKQQEAAQKQQLENHKIKNSKNLRKLKDAFNFDYNGQIIQIKSDKKKNLISKMVTPNVPKQKADKDFVQTVNKPKATFLKTFQVGKDEQNKMKKGRKNRDVFEPKMQDKIDVQFSKIKNPIEVIDVKEGVKAIFNQSTLQHKKKKVTDEELVKSRSTRKFSRNQYARIKTTTLRTKPQQQLGQDVMIVEPIVNQKNFNFKQEHAFNQTTKKRAKTESSSFRVRVEDANLKKQLVESVQEKQMKTQQPNCEDIQKLTQDIKKQGLSRIDKYNLHYSRNKGQTISQRKNSGEPVLPHIQVRSQTNYIKTRQKVKDGAFIRRELFRKFEEILRV